MNTFRLLTYLLAIAFLSSPGVLAQDALAVQSKGLQSRSSEQSGLLVMAHGGSDDWNQAVIDAVEPLRTEAPVAIAFGMANPHTLQEAVDKLEAQDVTRIEVIRLFISGDSFLEATEYAFHIRQEKPPGRFMHEPFPLRLNVPVQLSSRGLMDVTHLGGILADRTQPLMDNPENESVLVIGHGPGSDEENARWIARMDAMADSVRHLAPFHTVEVITLREDWTGKREAAEAAIRDFMEEEQAAGRSVLVVPFRLRGFGPYADVLEGFAYQADHNGFLPDARITDWIRAEFDMLKHLPPRSVTSSREPIRTSSPSPGHTH
ncbi:MAG: sirohydrochlorin chelatase [Rhodothermales bacterium]